MSVYEMGSISHYPKRRQDLRITDQELEGEVLYIIVDEETGSYYRFPEIEFGIFWILDGKTPLSEVKRKIEEKVGDIEIPLEHLGVFVADLSKKGLLEGTQKKATRRSVWRNLFYLRVKAFDPDRLLDFLVSPLSFLFQTPFLLTGLFLIAWSFLFMLNHRVEWLDQGKSLFHGWGYLALYLALLMVGMIHEMGHALTCKYYGGKVKEMGFMFIYFQPAFYANVTDAYVFRNKMHRVFVGAAGLFFQFAFGALVALLWYFSVPGSGLATFLVGMMGMSGFTALWNLNPLIKLDGYYVLCDLLEVVNLRANSFQYLGWLFQKWLFNLPQAEENLAKISPRLRNIYFWYGVLGLAYTSLLIFLLLLFLARFLIRKLSGFGLLLFAGGIAWGFWNWKKHAAPGWSSLASKIKESPELQRTVTQRARKIGAVAAVVLVVGLIPARWSLKGACEVRPALKRALAPRQAGVLVEVSKSEGETVRKGEIFARLDDFETRRELIQLRFEERLKQEHLDLLKAEYGSFLTQARGELSEAELALSTHLVLSPHTLEESRHAAGEARSRYLKLRDHYLRLHAERAQLETGAAPERVAQIEEELRKAEADLTVAQSQWERYQALAREDLVSPRELEEKKSAFQRASSDVARLREKLDQTKKDLVQEEQTAYQDYRAAQREYLGSREALARTEAQIEKTDPQKLHETVTKTRKNYRFAQQRSVQIREAISDLDRVRARIKTDEERLRRMVIASPIPGIIMTPHVTELLGKMVGAGQAVAWVYQPGPMIFEIRVDELDISEVPRESDKRNDVVVKLMALPGRSFKGRVRRIIPESLSNPSGKAYLVDVEVLDSEGRLLPGMQGTGKIYGRRYPVLWQIVRRPVKFVLWKLWSLF